MVEVSDLLHWEGIVGVLGGDAGSGHLGGRFGLDQGVEARGIWSSEDVVLGGVDGADAGFGLAGMSGWQSG